MFGITLDSTAPASTARTEQCQAIGAYLTSIDQFGCASADLERDFVSNLAAYSIRLGIGPEAWKAVGVTDETLRKAGID